MTTHLKPAIVLFAILTIITGLVYPTIVTVMAQLLFPHQANGSLVLDDRGMAIGSELIGQAFSDPKYFWGRPSATSPYPYNAGASTGSNLGPTNSALADAVKARIQTLRDADPTNTAPMPVDLVTTSASGLDPHISLAAANYQVSRVAGARHLDKAKIRDLVLDHTETRQALMLGEPRINVLQLNLALDKLSP